MNKRFAVMDLGTNTFHLLIVDRTSPDLKELVHEEVAVKLGEGGINKGLIQPPAFNRGMVAMQRFKELIIQNDVQQLRAIATSALRNASNGQDFINQVKEKTAINIEMIDGDTEATYIYKGIKAGGHLTGEHSLIVDIGGGSVEFIICNNDALLWKHSFEIGAARLMDRFHQKDPITAVAINELKNYLDDCLKELFIATDNYHIQNLIGSSGVFESYAEVIENSKGNPFELKTTKNYNFDHLELVTLIDNIILSTHNEREKIKGILPIRVDMIVVASLLTRFVMDKLVISEVIMSANSLKEGVLAEMMGD